MALREILLPWDSQPQEAAGIDQRYLTGLALVADAGESTPLFLSPYPSKSTDGYMLSGTKTQSASGRGWQGASGSYVTAKTTSANPDELLQFASGSDFTLQFVVDNVGVASGTNPGWIRGGSTSGSNTFVVTNGTTRRPWLRVGGTDVLKPTTGTQWTDGSTVNLIVVFRSSASAEFWFNGELQYSASHAVATPALSGPIDGFYTLLTNSGTENLRGGLVAFRAWRRALPGQLVKDLAGSPWQLFEPRRIYVPTASGGAGAQTLTPSLYSDADTFHSPTVTPGAVSLSPSLYSDGDAFYSPTVTSGTTLTPSLYTDGDTFYSATVSPGAVTLTPSLFSDGDTFHSPTVSNGTVLRPDLYANSASFYSATVTPGAVALSPSLFTDADTFYSATVFDPAASPSVVPYFDVISGKLLVLRQLS